jgi:putative PIN family toxin of toxin-antitoxin system
VRAVIDTNVFVSGVFFSGVPRRVYLAWTEGLFAGVLTSSILAEYRSVAGRFVRAGGDAQVEQAVQLVLANSDLIEAPKLARPLCRDPNDDMFLAAALAGSADFVVSGDKAVLALDRTVPFRIVRPRDFWSVLNVAA